MAFDLEEQEKIDQVKAWWARFGGLVSGLVSLVLALFIAYYAWGWYQNYKSNQALGYYDIINTVVKSSRPSDSDAVRIQEALKALQNDYKGTAYPARASLVASKFFMQRNDNVAAQQALQWVISDSGEKEMIPVAQLQLASVLMDQQKFDEAAAQLSNPPADFKALFLDRQGDIYLSQGRKADAVQAWKDALKEQGLEPTFINTVQLKLNVIGGETLE